MQMKQMFKFIVVGASAAMAFSSASVMAADMTGAGATFPYPIYAKWAETYKANTGNGLNYQSVGSGAGIKQIKAKTVEFGASDMPLKAEELEEAGLMQFPAIMGGVVTIVNLDGVKPGQLKMTGKVVADIYLGKITMWNDARIAALNPGLNLPAMKITVVHRSDGSGTTFNFTNYLSKISPEWKQKAGEGTSVAWPAGVGGKGNEGVAAYTRQIRGGIGYVEYAYALQNKLSYTLMKNAAGNFVKPSDDSFQAAAASANWGATKDFYLVMTNAPGAQAWPIAATVFIMMYKKPKDAARSQEALKFFKWALKNGQPQAAALDYVPLPDSLVKQIEAYWAQNIGARK